MKRLTVALAAVIALLTAGQALGKPADADGAPAALDNYERTTLLYWHEMQKFVHDANAWAHGCYQADVFRNLAAAETGHLAALQQVLKAYRLKVTLSDEIGEFNDPGLADLWEGFAFPCWVHLRRNLELMAWLEEYEIRGLAEAHAGTDEPLLRQAYTNLMAGERNHLRMLVSTLAQQGFAYAAQLLDPDELEEILAGVGVLPGDEDFAMNAGLNDAWYYPGTNGQGFFITVYPDSETVFLSWFTFDTVAPPKDSIAHVGHPCQKWLTAQGQFAGGQAELQVYSSRNGLFDMGNPPPALDRVGSILLRFEGCTSGSVVYDLPFAERWGVIPIRRVAGDNVALCEQIGAAGR